MNRMPAGQYIPGESPLHHLNATVKLCAFLVMLVAVVLAGDAVGFGLLLVACAVLTRLSALPVSAVIGSIGRLWMFFVVIFLMNALFFGGESAWLCWWIFQPSPEGMAQGALIVLRVAILMALGNLLTATTSPMEITAAVQRLMRPLRIFHIPTADIAMILTAAIQFIPTLLGEAETIRLAQTARGARFESRRLWEKAASFAPLVVPIFLSAFRRADELSMAMEARGWQRESFQKPERAAEKIPKAKPAGADQHRV